MKLNLPVILVLQLLPVIRNVCGGSYLSKTIWLSPYKALVYSIRVSQGYTATPLKCGEILNNRFIANFVCW